MRMKTRHMKKEMRIQTKEMHRRRIRFNRGVLGLFVWSRMTNPRPPIVNRKLDARPSMMYCPFTRYGMNATCKINNILSRFDNGFQVCVNKILAPFTPATNWQTDEHRPNEFN